MNNDQALAKLYRKRRIVKFIIILVALSLLVGVLALTGHAYATSNNYCSLCHEMSPEYVTWQASSHSKLACTACHQVDFIDQIYQHLRNQYFLPIVTPAPVANAVCEKCHNLKIRTVSATGDIKIPHQQHLAQSVLCVDCHSGVAHGQIAVRQETVDGNWERWTAAMGKAQMGRQFTATGMKQCIDCHESRRVSTKCEACHTEIVMPPDHKTAKWLGQGEHGRQARINLAACDRCHSFSSTGQVIHGLDKLTNYTRTNTFCAECHQKAPANHGPTWRIEHGAKAVD
ncbi:MAG TPA: NapC/NirT family cytochrome c, partial [Desulfobacteria bacterium]|nr:NapC/NirT family cytochrome c [Desulfobacteria bacterium]